MPFDLIPPHGDVTEPVTRTVPAAQAAEVAARWPKTAPIPLSDADLLTLYRIGDGGLSPLNGPMSRAEYDQVLDEQVIVRNGKTFAWTIPLAFPVEQSVALKLQTGTDHPLTNAGGEVVGKLNVSDVYPWDKKKYNASVYGTTRDDHAGARIATADPRTFLVGGLVHVLPPSPHPQYGDRMLTPHQARELFRASGFQRVIALAAGDESALVTELERLTSEGVRAGGVLNPLVGDADAAARLTAKVSRAFEDQVLVLGLEYKTFHAGPKEAVMRAIYRQNHGFTDILFGGPNDAVGRAFDELKGDLKIRVVTVG